MFWKLCLQIRYIYICFQVTNNTNVYYLKMTSHLIGLGTPLHII